MHPIQQDMQELRSQLEKGSIRKAYKALLDYMLSLRTHFMSCCPGFAVTGLYQGFMDMTYFALVPPALKPRGLKIAIVFNYEAFKFEAWLAGSNRKVQREYWEMFRDSQWPAYRVVTPAKGIDSIVECDLAVNVDFSDQGALTARIETAATTFIDDMQRYLSKHQSPGEAESFPLHPNL